MKFFDKWKSKRFYNLVNERLKNSKTKEIILWVIKEGGLTGARWLYPSLLTFANHVEEEYEKEGKEFRFKFKDIQQAVIFVAEHRELFS